MLLLTLMRRHGKVHSASVLRHSEHAGKHKEGCVYIFNPTIEACCLRFFPLVVSGTKHILF